MNSARNQKRDKSSPSNWGRRAVNEAAPRAKRYTIYDSALPGFGLRVSPSGEKSFVFVYRAGSGRAAAKKRVTLGKLHRSSDARTGAKGSRASEGAMCGSAPIRKANSVTAEDGADVRASAAAVFLVRACRAQAQGGDARLVHRHFRTPGLCRNLASIEGRRGHQGTTVARLHSVAQSDTLSGKPRPGGDQRHVRLRRPPRTGREGTSTRQATSSASARRVASATCLPRKLEQPGCGDPRSRDGRDPVPDQSGRQDEACPQKRQTTTTIDVFAAAAHTASGLHRRPAARNPASRMEARGFRTRPAFPARIPSRARKVIVLNAPALSVLCQSAAHRPLCDCRGKCGAGRRRSHALTSSVRGPRCAAMPGSKTCASTIFGTISLSFGAGGGMGLTDHRQAARPCPTGDNGALCASRHRSACAGPRKPSPVGLRSPWARYPARKTLFPMEERGNSRS